jgi:arginyl-tRNA synthetase
MLHSLLFALISNINVILQACEAIESKTKCSGKISMQCIQEELVRTFTEAIEAAFPDVPDVGVPVVPSSKFGDYQCNTAMQLSQLLKAQGVTSVSSGKCEIREKTELLVV